MTALQKVQAAAKNAVTQSLDSEDVQDVRVEQDVGPDGEPVLRVTIVLSEGAADKLDGERFLTTLVSIKRGVRASGEERQTLVEYATPSELEDDGDSES